MAAIKKLCNQGILIEHGCIEKKGKAEDIVKFYLDKITMGISNNHEVQDIQPIKINDLGLLN